jgi:epoxyqueuosine reductase QueG
MFMKEEVREIVKSFGADLCGFANIDRFEDAPAGFSPPDILPVCKTVISFAFALPQGLMKVPPRLIYGHYNYSSCPEVDMIALKSAKKIEEMFQCVAVPIPCDNPYEYWDVEKTEGKGLLSMKHLAVKAGLGTLGKSTLLLNEHFGNMLTLGAILTDLDLPSDELAKNICIEDCKRCIDSCPVGAISNNGVNQKACRQNTYGKTARGFDTVDCNLCRTVCRVNCGDTRLK